MNQQNKYKLITIAAFIILIIMAVLLFFSVIRMNYETETGIAGPFVMILAIVVLSVVLLIVFLNNFNQYIILTEENKKLKEQLEEIRLSRKQEEEEEKKQKEQEEKNMLDVDAYIKKILPDDKTGKIILEKYCEKILINISKEFEIVQGMFFVRKYNGNTFSVKGLYAYYSEKKPEDFKFGEGLSGQVAKDQKILDVPDIPDDYIVVYSGLGKAAPDNLLIIPVINKNKTIGIIELTTFKLFDKDTVNMFAKVSEKIGEKLVEYIKPKKK